MVLFLFFLMKPLSSLNRSTIILKATTFEYDLIIVGGGITGAGITLAAPGVISDTSMISDQGSGSNDHFAQTIIMHNYPVPTTGTYYVTVYAYSNKPDGILSNSHLLTFANMTRSA